MKPLTLSAIFFILVLQSRLKTSFSGDASQRATYKKIYSDITHFTSCFRRFNGTHQIGCASDSIGNTGVLHYVNDSSSLKWLLNEGDQIPYIALISSAMFTNATVRSLMNSGKINGILVIFTDASDPTEYPDEFSPDSTCPGMDYGLYADKPDYSCDKMNWNPYGNSLMFEDFPFPISIILNQTEADKVLGCYKEHNAPDASGSQRPYPLCAAEVKAFMHGAKDSATCWRRTNMVINLSPEQYCQTMGSSNIHATLGDPSKTRPNSSLIVLGARIDAFSLFENLVPGANNHISGIIALLAAAEVLGRVKGDILNSTKDVWFMLFEGEAFDYIGSTRVVYDIRENKFPVPLKLDDIGFFVELYQLASAVQNMSLYMHTDPLSEPEHRTQIKRMKNAMNESAVNISFQDATPNRSLPPSSVQQFLKVHSMPTIVVTDHADTYKNKYFNSRLDTAHAIGLLYPPGLNETEKYNYVTPQARALADASTTIARGIYRYATGQDHSATSNLEADVNKVANMLYCFLINPKCDLFYTVVEPGSNTAVLDRAEMPYPFYVSVTAIAALNPIVYIIHQLLLYYSGDIMFNMTAEACNASKMGSSTAPGYFWINGPLNQTTGQRTGLCVKSNTLYSNATSPAFEIEGYDFTSKQYPTWTESVWPSNDAFHVRIFLLASNSLKGVTLGCGLLVLVLSGLLSYCIKKRAYILFAKEGIL